MSSIACYALAGFFFYTVCALSFIGEFPGAMKYGVMGAFLVPALLCLLAGLGLNHFAHWQRNTGIVLLSAGAFTALGAVTMLCMFNTKELEPFYNDRTRNLFSDYGFGTGCIALLVFGGLHLILRGNRLAGGA